VWRSYVEEWDRSLRATNRPQTTRYNYELAVTQFADFLAGPALPAFLTKMDMTADDDSDAARGQPRRLPGVWPTGGEPGRIGRAPPMCAD
jgi:hypothetical protein